MTVYCPNYSWNCSLFKVVFTIYSTSINLTKIKDLRSSKYMLSTELTLFP